MRVGVVFPTYEIPPDPGGIRDFLQTVEALGYDHVVFFDHVLGANVANRPNWGGLYTHEHAFHEPFVTMGFAAAVTERVELVTGILILPQRQTVLVAKQTAEIDVLSGGRLRLGVGVGWSDVEFQALGQDFSNRGRRMEEQVDLLRRLWTNELVDYDGRWHKVVDAGLNPLPLQRPIPIWFGAHAPAAMDRLARLGDGWLPLFWPTGDKGAVVPGLEAGDPRALVEDFRARVRKAGRDPAEVGLDGRLTLGGRTPDDWKTDYDAWKSLGATHVTVRTLHSGCTTVAEHLDLFRRFAESGIRG